MKRNIIKEKRERKKETRWIKMREGRIENKKTQRIRKRERVCKEEMLKPLIHVRNVEKFNELYGVMVLSFTLTYLL